MAAYFCLLLVLCAIVSVVSTEEVYFKAEMSNQLPLGLSKQPKENGTNRRKRSLTILSSTDRDNIVKTINDLRRAVGAADMPYMTWNNELEIDLNNWTQHCNFGAPAYSSMPTWIDEGASSWRSNFPVNITQSFNDSTEGLPLRSIYLTQIAASETLCSTATVQGRNYSYVYLSAVAYVSSSLFNNTVAQYTIGEACTACVSGVFWCDYGLCRADCSSAISTCFCYPDCANCADWNATTCTCQCLDGWTDSRCQTKVDNNVTTPTCSTTIRRPYSYQTTTTTTTTTTIPTTKTTTTIPSAATHEASAERVAVFLMTIAATLLTRKT